MPRMPEFLFHGQRVVVEDIEATYIIENGKLLTMIEHGAREVDLERQERRVRKLLNLLDRTPSGRFRTLRQIMGS